MAGILSKKPPKQNAILAKGQTDKQIALKRQQKAERESGDVKKLKKEESAAASELEKRIKVSCETWSLMRADASERTPLPEI